MKFDVTIAVPSSGMCRTQFAVSLARLVMYFSQNKIYPESGKQGLDIVSWEGTGVSHNREKMVREFLQSEATHLLFIDDDMGFNPNVLHVLAAKRQPIVGCNYRIRTPPAPFMAWREGEVKTTKESTGLEEVDYLGFGFCLMERRALEAVEEPRFMIDYLKEEGKEGVYTTEDSCFFRKNPFPCFVDHDASKLVWHTGNIHYSWADDFSQNYKLFK